MIRVALVDDQHMIRAGIRALLERSDDLVVVGEAADGAGGVALVEKERPDVVLMDVRMPRMDGLEATRRILESGDLRETRIVVLTTFDEDDYVFEAIRLGAAGFLLKDSSPDELRNAVRAAADGDAVLSPSVTRRVMRAAAARRPTRHPGVASLTDREREVLVQVASGLSNKEVGEALYISPATARTYVSRLLAKLGSRDRAQLVVLAWESGLMDDRVDLG